MSMNNNDSCKQQQCSAEKRNRCRQLQRWNKNLLVLLGVEQICQRLQTSWQQRTAASPNPPAADHQPPPSGKESPPAGTDRFQSPDDQDPNQSCFVCQKRRFVMDQTDDTSPGSTRSSCSPKPTTVDAYLSSARVAPARTTTTSMDASLNGSGASAGDVPPFLEEFNKLYAEWSRNAIATTGQQFWPVVPMYLTGGGHGHAATMASLCPSPGGGVMTDSSDQPLDLSLKRKRSAAAAAAAVAAAAAARRQTTTFDQRLPSPKLTSTSVAAAKRSYSKADLEAAVLDIRSGRLGTRRASVIYGVPRSTLRNKIHKLEVSSGRGGATAKGKAAGLQAINAGDRGGGPLPAVAHNVEQRRRDETTTLQDLALQVCAKQLNSAFELQSQQQHQQYGAVHNNFQPSNRTALLGSIGLEAFRNATIHAVVQAVKDISGGGQKVEPSNQHSHLSPSSAQGGNTGTNASGSAADLGHSPCMQDAGSKKMRRKRGQYRKYDKNALALAVQSVRRGEMSVHKAGSFYGVPHSTLEYKVKERNLLRNKKQPELTNGRLRSMPDASDSDCSLMALNSAVAAVQQSQSEPNEPEEEAAEPIELNGTPKTTAASTEADTAAVNPWRKLRRKKAVPKKIVADETTTVENELDCISQHTN